MGLLIMISPRPKPSQGHWRPSCYLILYKLIRRWLALARNQVVNSRILMTPERDEQQRLAAVLCKIRGGRFTCSRIHAHLTGLHWDKESMMYHKWLTVGQLWGFSSVRRNPWPDPVDGRGTMLLMHLLGRLHTSILLTAEELRSHVL